MFNIIEILQNYLTRELLPYNFSSKVALQNKLVAAILSGKLFAGSVFAGQCCSCGYNLFDAVSGTRAA